MQDVPQLQKCLKSYLYVVSWRAAVSFNLNDKKKKNNLIFYIKLNK